MYLKRLEIHGFKSVADQTVLTFQPGITAIVGPNGSGKSNIADSLRWVMGEHNLRNLRGAKFEDIIFAGSEDRKPLGMADVTLILDNSDNALPLDFSEIAVTRRIYRSGESEFMINKAPVRLKDIQELFYDTGLGKESYSIIGQGKIDSILSLRPEERRMIFEEAAGIMKYKNKKAVAVKKLSETENSLLRIQDILQEIETQMVPLSRQAETAKAYLSVQKDLKTLEVNHYRQELSVHKESLEKLEEEISRIRIEQDNLSAEEESAQKEVSALKAEINSWEASAGAKQKLLMEEATKRERALGELNLFDQRRHFLQERLAELGEFISRQESKVSDLTNKIRNLREEAGMVNEEKNNLSREILEVEEDLATRESSLQETRGRLTQAKAELATALEKLSALKQDINEVSVQNDFRQEKKKELEENLELIDTELVETEEKMEMIRKELESVRERHRLLVSEAEKLRSERKKTESYLRNQEEKNQKIREKLRGIESRMTILEEMEKSHQGYFQGVKSLLEAGKEAFHKEIHGVVANLIKVERGYEVALEVALGSALQYLVITHDRYAREAIEYLKKYSAGRATFLSLNLIDAPPDRLSGLEALLAQHGCRPATEVVSYDHRYQAVVSHLLSGTIIAPNLAAAVTVAEKTGKKYRLVTLEGEVVAPGGAITGGKLDRKQVGLLTRKKERVRLQEEREDLLAFMNKGLEEEKRLRERLSDLTRHLEKVTAETQSIVIETNTLLKDLEIAVEKQKKTGFQREELLKSLTKIDSDLSAQAKAAGDLAELVRSSEEELAVRNREVRFLEESESKMLGEKEECLKRLSELSAKLAGIRQEWRGKESYLKEQENTLENLLAELEERKAEYAQTQEDIHHLHEDKESLEEKIKESDLICLQIEAELQQIKDQWQQALGRLTEKEERLREIHRSSGGLTAELHRLDLRINKLNSQIENINLHLSEVYGEDWRDYILAGWEPPLNPKQEIERLKRTLKEMEPVNIQAIEDYEKQRERAAFLSQQYSDLISAKNSLEKVIQEIEKTITKRFTETFYQVREAFIELFQKLFAGGKADLTLLDPENPLESGIEILAQPPGKRLQSLSLLSGGERAMTAIALLFAILRVKPSPFCILDEIDATLDDVNVKRFAELLNLFSRDLQFIVITHRRGTMETAGTLYGVTMEEKGVSKLISLDLKNKQAS